MTATGFTPSTGIGALTGKVILVTGGNSGLGKETILQLAKHQPQKIYLAARTESKAQDAIKSINSQLSQPVNIEWLPLDTSSFESVKAAAATVTKSTSRLDMLILNAGIMATPSTRSASGHELQLATNHIGHFLLTKLLMPTLQQTAAMPESDVRIVSLSSQANNMSPSSVDTIIDTEKLAAMGPWARYGASKAANILFAAELARRFPKLTSVSVHPGMIKTDLWKYDQQSNSKIHYAMSVFGRFLYVDTPTGAYNQLWAAAGAKRSELHNGGYYVPLGKLSSNNKFAKDAVAGRKLWEWTERELAKSGY